MFQRKKYRPVWQNSAVILPSRLVDDDWVNDLVLYGGCNDENRVQLGGMAAN